MALTPEDRAEVEAIVAAAVAQTVIAVGDVADALPEDATPADEAAAVEELAGELDAIVEDAVEQVDDGPADTITDPTGNDDDGLPDVIEDPLADAGIDVTPEATPEPPVEVAGVAPVVVDQAPERVHPYWRPIRGRR